MNTYLEHANITVADADEVAEMLCTLFDWKIRWKGPSIYNGYTVHVGSQDSYIALYMQPGSKSRTEHSHSSLLALNHLGVVVEDLSATESRAEKLGLVCHDHGDYEPGMRFYTDLPGGLEVEVVSYT